ncbi:MAG TPA: hypothetical protein PLR86_11390, partial [Planctomycetota bacterium]|nr:hypothetical protein [Planctomycetota bacterium]
QGRPNLGCRVEHSSNTQSYFHNYQWNSPSCQNGTKPVHITPSIGPGGLHRPQGGMYHVTERFAARRGQIGGQDQWGNMVAGTELIRKMYDDTHQAHCLTIPLLINPSTGQKFGKSIGGTSVWLDKTQTPVFDYYQFWRNTEDTMVED